MTKLSKKELGEKLFIEDNRTAKEIAKALSVTEATVSRWNKQGNWKARQLFMKTATNSIKEKMMAELARLLAEKNINTDAVSKLTSAIEKLDKKISASVVISVMKEFDNWLKIQKIDKSFLSDSMDWHKQFVKYCIDTKEK